MAWTLALEPLPSNAADNACSKLAPKLIFFNKHFKRPQLINAIASLGGNMYQDAGMVAICCNSNYSQNSPEYVNDGIRG